MEKIRIHNEELEIVSIRQNGSLLIIEFPQIIDISNKDLSSIDIYTSGGIKCTKEPITGFITIYKIEGNTVILSNDGSVYVEPKEPEEPTPVEPHIPTPEEIALQLENAKRNKIVESNKKLEQYLLEHPLLYTDGKYYSVTLEKQSILQGNLMGYQLELQMGVANPTLEWNSTGDVCIPWSYENLSALAIAIKNYVKPFVGAQQAYEKCTNLCTTLAEVENVVIDYNIA